MESNTFIQVLHLSKILEALGHLTHKMFMNKQLSSISFKNKLTPRNIKMLLTC